MKLFRALQHCRPGHKSLFNIIDVLHRSNLPYKRIVLHLISFLRRNKRPFDTYRLCQHLVRSRIPIDSQIVQVALQDVTRAHSHLGHKLFQLLLRYSPCSVRLDQHLPFFRSWIRDPAINPADIMDVFLGPAEARYVYRRIGLFRQGAGRVRGLARRNMSANALVHLLHGLAYEFAHTPHLSARSAFRQVHLCYLLVRFYNRSVRSILTRAMTHSAVVRPLLEGGWVSAVKFSFVLRWVKTVEGRGVAHRLDEIIHKWSQLNNLKRRGQSFARR